MPRPKPFTKKGAAPKPAPPKKAAPMAPMILGLGPAKPAKKAAAKPVAKPMSKKPAKKMPAKAAPMPMDNDADDMPMPPMKGKRGGPPMGF